MVQHIWERVMSLKRIDLVRGIVKGARWLTLGERKGTVFHVEEKDYRIKSCRYCKKDKQIHKFDLYCSDICRTWERRRTAVPVPIATTNITDSWWNIASKHGPVKVWTKGEVERENKRRQRERV